MSEFSLKVNGKKYDIDCSPETPLIYVLRNQLNLMGAKLGCGLEQCGACAVLANGEKVLSCVRAASEFKDQEIITVEGLVRDGEPSTVQKAFIQEGAAQCGYCTAGLVVAVTALLNKKTQPSREEISSALHDHLCRCGSHFRVLKAIDRAKQAFKNAG